MSERALSVIVPARNAGGTLDRCLNALMASDLPRSRWELIVVDDGSTDATAETAARFGARVIRLTGAAHGPAHARNRGAEVADGEVLVFIDADVCVHGDALRRILAHFGDAACGAVFGAYDARPPAPGLVSQYRNLVHRWVHVQNAGPAHTFWAGCGAVRRSAFLQVGGFDEQRYARPQIEDIELGHRLRAAGWSITLDPAIASTHLKRWTLWGGIVTDIRDRGIPWAELMLAERDAGHASALNLRATEKVATGLVGAGAGCVLLSLALGDARLAGVAALLCAAALVPSLPLLRWLARERGSGFALGAVPLRLVYYAGNVISVGAAVLRRPRSRASTRARTERAATVVKR